MKSITISTVDFCDLMISLSKGSAIYLMTNDF